MSAIDQRVVRMEFQNEQFESGIKSSIKSLDNLKNSLNLEGASKGLSELGSASKSFSLASIGETVDEISQKFTALGIAGITALQNITNRAVDAGIALTKSLTVDQLTSGWTKYEQKTASVQTLMNSTGKSMEEINKYLDQMMWFSDETSYGFTDMTAALAQMTSSGGDIEKLVPMLMGMANATAFAGKGATEFQRVVYNLSQSYASGKLQLIDWKSVENAGAASVQLKQALIDAGVALGTIEAGEKTIENFNQDLTESGWVTKEVMEQGFGMFAEMSQKAYEMVRSGEVETASEAYEILGQTYDNVAIKAARSAQEAKTFGEAIDATKDAVSSGWMSTFDIIFGNYEEAKALWTDLANGLWDVFAAGAADRNEMLQTWKDLGGRDSLIQSAINLINALGAILGPIRDAFRTIFPPITAERLFELTKGFEEFTAKLILSEDASHGIQKVFEAIFTVVKLLLSPIRLVISALGLIPSTIGPAIEGILSLIDALLSGVDFTNAFEEASRKVVEVFDFLTVSYLEGGRGLAGVLEAIFDSINEVIRFGFDTISKLTGMDLSDIRDSMVETVQSIRDAIVGFVLDLQRALTTGDWSKFQEFFDYILVSYWEGGSGLAGVLEVMFDVLNDIITAGLQKLSEITGINLGDFIETTRTAVQSIRNVIVGFVLDIQRAFASGDWSKFHDAFKGLAESFDPLVDFVSGVKAKALEGLVSILTAFALSLSPIGDKMQSGMEKIGNAINPLRIFQSLLQTIIDGITNLFGGFVDNLMSMIDRINFENIYKTFNVSFFGIFAVGVLKAGQALGSFAKEIKSINLGGIGDSFSKAIDELANSLKAFQANIKADVLKKIAISVGILAAALIVLANVDPDKLAQGIVSLTIVIGELTGSIFGFSKAVKALDVKEISSTGLLLVEMAVAVLVLSAAVKKLSELSWGELIEGLFGTGVAIGELVAATIILSKYSDKIEKSGLSMLALSLALKTLAKAVTMMSELSWEDLIEGLTGVGVLLYELSKFTNSSGTLTKETAVSFIELAAALVILSKAVEKIGSLEFEEWAKGLAGVGILLFELSKFTNSALPQTKDMGAAILEVAAAMLVLGFAVGKFGSMNLGTLATGLIAMGIALGEITIALNYIPSDSAAKAAGVLVLALALVPLAGAMALIGALPLQNIIDGLIGIGGALLMFSLMMVSLSDVSGNIIQVSGAFAIFTVSLIPLTAALITLGIVPFDILLKGLIGIAGALAIFGIAGAVLSPMASGILAVSAAFAVFGVGMLSVGAGMALLSAGLIALAGSSAAVIAVAGQLAMAIGDALSTIITGVAKGIIQLVQIIGDNAPVIWNAFKNMMMQGLNTLAEVVPQMVTLFISLITGLSPQIIQTGLEFITNFLNGILSKIQEITSIVLQIIVGFVSAIATNMPVIVESAFLLIISFFDSLGMGIDNHLPVLVEKILGVGWSLVEGLIKGIVDNIPAALEAIKNLGSSLIEGLMNVLHINSPSKDGIEAGEGIDEGVEEGVRNGEGGVLDSIDGLGANILDLLDFSGEAKDAGSMNIEALLSGFTGMQKDATDTAEDLESGVLSTIEQQDGKFEDRGKANITAYLTGAKSMLTEVTQYIETMMANMLGEIDKKKTEFEELGKKLIQAFLDAMKSKEKDVGDTGEKIIQSLIDGIKSKTDEAESAVSKMADNMVSAIKDKKGDFESIGENLVSGFVKGIKSKIDEAAAAAAEMARKAMQAAKSELDENSPSKEFFKMGEFVSLGFANGISDATRYSTAESQSMADEAIETVKNSLSKMSKYLSADDFDSAPTIRPVLDLSDVQKGAKSIDSILNADHVIDISAIEGNVKKIQANVENAKTAQIAPSQESSPKTINNTFNQYNTSPKALSRFDIYRQTKNLFAQQRKVVDET